MPQGDDASRTADVDGPRGRAPMTDSERLTVAYATIGQLREEAVRYRRALDRVHDRLDHAGAYRPGTYLHGLWREVDAAIGSPGRRR